MYVVNQLLHNVPGSLCMSEQNYYLLVSITLTCVFKVIDFLEGRNLRVYFGTYIYILPCSLKYSGSKKSIYILIPAQQNIAQGILCRFTYATYYIICESESIFMKNGVLCIKVEEFKYLVSSQSTQYHEIVWKSLMAHTQINIHGLMYFRHP